MCSVFVRPNSGMPAGVWDQFLTCAQMFMHAITHEGCTNTLRKSALKADFRREKKLPCSTGESNLSQYRHDAVQTVLRTRPSYSPYRALIVQNKYPLTKYPCCASCCACDVSHAPLAAFVFENVAALWFYGGQPRLFM